MALGEQPLPIARWFEDPTTARSITSGLEQLWAQVVAARQNRDGSSGQAAGIVRTRVLNFLAYATSAEECARALGAMGPLTEIHPGRSILLHGEPGARRAELGAELLAYGQGDGGACFDQVRLKARGMTANELASVAGWLCLRELPILLWWLPELSIDDPQFAALADVVDLVIVDSASFSAPTGLRQLSELASRFRGHPDIVDLNWGRLIEWRELAAQLFDAPAAGDRLKHVGCLEIAYQHNPRQPRASSQALLLGGWLAACLGVRPASAGRSAGATTLRLNGDGTTIDLVLREVTAGGTPGQVERLEFACAGASRFAIEADPRRKHGSVTVAVEGGAELRRGFGFEPPSDARLLAEEIESLGVDCALSLALARGAEMAELIEG